MNRILASPVDRLSCRQFDMQTMCYVLLAFHTTRISLLFNQKEDVRFALPLNVTDGLILLSVRFCC